MKDMGCPSLREPQQDSKQSISPGRGFRVFFCTNASVIVLPGRLDPELATVDFFLSPFFLALCTVLLHKL